MSTQDFASLYSSGDLILQNPIESSSIFLMIVVVCASIEYLFSLADRVDSKFFRQMFDTISEEVLVVGVLSLMLTFGSSLFQNLPQQWAVMFDWAHICLLFMGIMFVVLLCLVCLNVFASSKRWQKFEADRISANVESHSNREQRYRKACEKFKVALRAYGYPQDVNFTSYILHGEKDNLVELGNLSWKSWLALSTIVVLNAQRTKAVPQHPSPDDPDIILNETDNIINIASYVAVAGYGTLALFLAIHHRLQHRFRQYLLLTNATSDANPILAMVGAARSGSPDGQMNGDLDAALVPTSKTDLDDPLSFLLWQSKDNSMAMVQAVLMFLVWYTAVFCLNMMYKSFTLNIGLTLLILGAAITPIVVFIVMVPWTLTTIAILSSLGTALQEDWIKAMLKKAEDKNETRLMKTEGPSATDRSAGGTVERRPLRPVILDEPAMQRLAQSYRQLNSNETEEL